MNLPASTPVAAAFAKARMTWTLLQFVASIGGSAALPVPAAADLALALPVAQATAAAVR
jgi:hypothetical protein